MSSSTLSSNAWNEKRVVVNIRTELLVFGYTQSLNIKNQIIPTSIIHLIITFYYSKSKLIYICNTTKHKPPSISIAELDDNIRYKIDVKLLNDAITINEYSAHTMCGICYVNDFSLPQYVFAYNANLNRNKLYDVIFVNQSADYGSVNAYIIDSYDHNYCDNKNEINAYCWKLPSFSQKPFGTSLQYSSKYGLVSVGDSINRNDFVTLKFEKNMKSDDDWKWQHADWKWNRKRRNISSAFITDDKLICCGVQNYLRYVDVYDFAKKRMTKLCDMNNDRRDSGIYVDKFNNNRVYIGGGYQSRKTFEYYDINKNQWISLSNTNQEHTIWPIIWSDQPYIINIASSYKCNVFEKLDIRQNKWIGYLPNNHKSLNDIFGIKNNFTQMHSRLLMALDSN